MRRFPYLAIGLWLASLACFVSAVVVFAQPGQPGRPSGSTLGEKHRAREYDQDGDHVGVNLKFVNRTPTPAESGRCFIRCDTVADQLQASVDGGAFQGFGGVGGCTCPGVGVQSVCVGSTCDASGTAATCLGHACIADGGGDVAVGHNAACDGPEAVCVGKDVTGLGIENVCVGFGGTCSAQDTTCVGHAVSCAGIGGTCVGHDSVCVASSTCVGNASACNANSVGVGDSSLTTNECVAVGKQATCSGAGHIMLGNAGHDITQIQQLFIGGIQSSATPPDAVVQPIQGVGTNIAGADLTVAAGRNTGNADAGSIIFRIGSAGAGGTGNGTFVFPWTISAVTASHGNLLPAAGSIYDIGASATPVDELWVDDVRSAAGFRWAQPIVIAQTEVDATQCVKGTTTINGGPKVASITCADDASGVIYGVWDAPDSWNGSALELDLTAVNVNAAPSGQSAWDVSCQCRGEGEIPSSTWGTGVDMNFIWATQFALNSETVSMTCAGTCAANDTVFWRAVVDAVNTTTTQVADVFVISGEVEYVRGTNLAD